MTITLNNLILDSISFEYIKQYIPKHNQPYFNNKSGIDQYRLLSYLSQHINKKVIIDIGTETGGSALALSTNSTNKIISYDIINNLYNSEMLKTIPNIEFRCKNCLEDKNELINSSIISLDTVHDGIHEKMIYDFLIENKFSGLLIMDDIIDFPGLAAFWNTIPIKKLDITKYGHRTGTGLVIFNNDEIILQ